MRLPEAKIKEAILHPEKIARNRAVSYFADCYSRDPEVMPLAIKAMETFGRENAFSFFHVWAGLKQTEDTVAWAVRELYREEVKTSAFKIYASTISRLLCDADVNLVHPHAEEILQAPTFSENLRDVFKERLAISSWNEERCWNELEKIWNHDLESQYSEEKGCDFEYARRVVEALAPQGNKYASEILELMRRDCEGNENEDRRIILAMAAGEMRLEAAIPILAQNLREAEPDEWVCIESDTALSKIGTDAAVLAVVATWADGDWGQRLGATHVMGNIHCEISITKGLEYLATETDETVRTFLAAALLGQFAHEAVQSAYELVKNKTYNPFDCDLQEDLVAVSIVLGESFPEFQEWKKEVVTRRAKQDRKLRESFHFDDRDLDLFAPRQSAVEDHEDHDEDEPNYNQGNQVPFIRAEEKVGRNDPCPCGSGKKFKKCCLNKTRAVEARKK
jgi:SEC-C motif